MLLGLAVIVGAVTFVVPTRLAVAVEQPSGDATAVVETDPVEHGGDAADDPAIWVHPTDPSRSVVIGNDKRGALEVYDLSGQRIQQINEGFFGNVDVRTGFATGVGPVDIVVVSRRGIRIYAIDPTSRLLINVSDTTRGSFATPINGEGLCLYRSPLTGASYVFTNARNGMVNQHELHDSDGDGLVEVTMRRSWDVGTETEGCVADDVSGALYISEENVGIWKYDAEPTAPTTPSDRTLVDGTVAAGGHIRPDAEGLTIVDTGAGTGYLVVSSQAASDTLNSFVVYDRQSNEFVREFRVVDGVVIDGSGAPTASTRRPHRSVRRSPTGCSCVRTTRMAVW